MFKIYSFKKQNRTFNLYPPKKINKLLAFLNITINMHGFKVNTYLTIALRIIIIILFISILRHKLFCVYFNINSSIKLQSMNALHV